MAKRDVNSHALTPDHATIRKFLNELRRDWFHLYSIDPNNPDHSRVYGHVADGVEDALDWIDRQQGHGFNVYYALNTPGNKQAKKAKKGELRWLFGTHVDIDLPKDVDRHSPRAQALIAGMIDRAKEDHRLPGVPLVVMSGNGVQVVWLFDEALKATEDNQSRVETVNKQLAKHYGAQPGTHNSERILRLPGTGNFPNAIKLAKGYAPVMSQLVCLPDRDYCLSDFSVLPKMDLVTIRETPAMKDYRRFSYSDNWTPYRWSDVLRTMPQLPNEVTAKYRGDGTEGDRSTAVWRLVRSLLDFFVLELDEDAELWQDDDDVKRNIMDLCFEGAEHHEMLAEIMGHIEDHEYGAAKLGADVSRAIEGAADDKLGPSVRLEAKARTAQELAAVAAKPEDAVTVDEASKAFIAWVANSVPKDHLPVAQVTATGPASRQPCTLSNVRHALVKSGISARWDAMRDEVRFTVDPSAGLGGANPQRPAFNFAKATSKAHRNLRSGAEVSLMLDALAQLGMVARSELTGFLFDIARESTFHPLEDYCTSVPWDGVDRIEELTACLETPHPLVRRYLETFLHQCVAAVLSLRQYQRTDIGLQLSSTVVIVGPQGIGKSTFWERLAPPGMLSRGRSLQIGHTRQEDSMSACLSGLICQLAEIASSMRRSEADALKDFQSGTVDTYRVSYSPRTVIKPRMTVFVGTANEDFMLTDPTGSRRYLAMRVSRIDWAALNALCEAESLQQLWAQAWRAVMVDRVGWTLGQDEDETRERENAPLQALSAEEAALDEYMSSVTKMYQGEWLTYSQVCKLLGVNYAPRIAHGLRVALEKRGCEYRAKVREGIRVHQKVFQMPVTAERLDQLRITGR